MPLGGPRAGVMVAIEDAAVGPMPSFIGGGAGTAQTAQATNLAVPYPSSIQANDLLLMQIGVRDTDGTVTTPSSPWELLFGPDGTNMANCIQFIYGAIATGSESGTLSVDWGGTATGVVAVGRMYLFRDTAQASYTEGADIFTGTGGVTSVTMPTVATTGLNRLAVAFLAMGLNRAAGSATGETGGDWTEAVAEYTTTSGNDFTIQMQTASMAGGGTISGGTTTFTGSPRAMVRGFALLPT